jgi:hypothetical protein
MVRAAIVEMPPPRGISRGLKSVWVLPMCYLATSTDINRAHSGLISLAQTHTIGCLIS